MKRLSVLAVVALLVAGCGPVHPGAAAVVDGRSISIDTVDRAAAVYCTIYTAQSEREGGASPTEGELRKFSTVDLVLRQLADDIIEERGLTLDRTLFEISDEDRAGIQSTFGELDDYDEILKTFEESRTLFASLATIGADDAGEVLTAENVDTLASSGQQAVQSEVRARGVKFSPRLGIDADGLTTDGVGSLSVAPLDLGEDAPAPTACRD